MREQPARRAGFAAAGGRRLSLRPGAAVRFGRQSDNDLMIGVDDEWVSRHVGEIHVNAAGAVSAVLTQSRHAVKVITPDQSERRLEPRPPHLAQERIGLVWEHATLVVPGEGTSAYRIFVVTGEPPDEPRQLESSPAPATSTVASRLDHDERLLLTALAEPLLRFGSVAEPATYAMIAARVGAELQGHGERAVTSRMVRRDLEALFERLTGTERVPGLDSGDRMEPDEYDAVLPAMVRRLAVWAVDYGAVASSDLELLP